MIWKLGESFSSSHQLSSIAAFQDESEGCIRYISTPPKINVHNVGQSYLLNLSLLPGASACPFAALALLQQQQ